MSGCCGQSLFDSNGGIIKYQGNDMVAIEGSDTLERLLMGRVAIPYKQVLKGRFILKPGEDSYLMNHLGLGNNATLVAMVTKYDPKSKVEADNYIEYEYITNPGIKFPIAQVLTLNGNSTHRIPQLYLSNPNETYSVTVEVLVATVDDQTGEYSTTPPIITFMDYVKTYTGGVVGTDVPNSTNASEFLLEVDGSGWAADDLTWEDYDLKSMIFGVTDDIDTIANDEVRFEMTSRTPSDVAEAAQEVLYRVSVIDTSYNLTEVELTVNITY